MSAGMDAVSVKDLTKKYGSKVALSSITFGVEGGTFFGCFGPNGAGKSTLLRILTGQIQQTSGEAKVLGLDCRTQGVEIKRLVGIVPEVESPPSYLTASEFLEFAGKVRGIDDLDKKVKRWLDFFELQEAHGTLCRDLSKGMRQKVMLAAAFIHEPKLLFLDEPFINLDPIYQRKLREYLTELRDEGRTIFLNSHILEIAQRLCQEVIILDKGKVLTRENMSDMARRGEDLEGLFMRLVGGNHAGPP
ncbi:MAG TPA: ABC transporter ATP-binding protein [Methanomassiliicoccales archaeon]|nr:ABC transporter ATP-binding protein [Methanomassiliicoccales archaeon]